MFSRFTALFAISAAALAVAACSASSSEDLASDTSSNEALNSTLANHVHVMKMRKPSAPQAFLQVADSAGPSGAKLKYLGGPVISNVKVYAVYWGANVQFQDHINAFYPAVNDSAYFDWLSEYNTPTQTIGRGSFGGAVVDTNPPAGTSITDAKIQAEIGKLIDAGKLPPNDGNNLYMMYFPPGVNISGPNGAGSSCQEFCAYHGTFNKNGKYAYYGVMPDLGGACAQGCGDGSPQDNITEVSSHELIEAVTDGAVGVATQVGPPIAWYDSANGEIGDICAGKSAKVAGFTVQLEWSNKLKLCTGIGGGSGSSSSGSSGATSSSSSSSGSSGSSGTTSSSSSSSSGSSGSSGTTSSSSSSSGSSGSTGGTCKHDICEAGVKLSKGCDSCVTQLCAQDSYCCGTKWDATCVSEVGSICGQTCN